VCGDGFEKAMRATGQMTWVVSMSVKSERGVSAHATDAAKLLWWR
jgi:hypothetical protein